MGRIGALKKWATVFFLGLFSIVMATGCGQAFVLHPKGPVAKSELQLIYLTWLLVGVIIVPVIVITFMIVYRYRDKPGRKAPYRPEFKDSKVLEIIWWGVPIIIIAILGTITAKKTFELTRPPEPNAQPMTIDVTSLDWKWLFQYPGQKVATVNYLVIPTGRPIQFILTSDAPMNSFWIPSLGGQEYSMPGMALRLWLQSDTPGNYFGTGANFSGKGFAHMTFDVKAVPVSQFNSWVKTIKDTAPALSMTGYKQLAIPSLSKTLSFSSYPAGTFNDTVMANGGQYMDDMRNMDNSKMKENLNGSNLAILNQSNHSSDQNQMSGMSSMTNMSNTSDMSNASH